MLTVKEIGSTVSEGLEGRAREHRLFRNRRLIVLLLIGCVIVLGLGFAISALTNNLGRSSGDEIIFRIVQPRDGEVVRGVVQAVIEANVDVYGFMVEVEDVGGFSHSSNKPISNFTWNTNDIPNGEYVLRVTCVDLQSGKTLQDSRIVIVDNPNPTIIDSTYLYSVRVNGTFDAGEVHRLIVESLSISSTNPTYELENPQNPDITLSGVTINAVPNRGAKIMIQFNRTLPNWMLEILNELIENVPQLVELIPLPERLSPP